MYCFCSVHVVIVFFFKQKTAYEMRISDWSSDVCSKHYTRDRMFHEPFVTLGFLAAVTRTLELAPAVMILPQRQTALVAKQAAEVDVLSGGGLRFGVGLGWNAVEYEAMGKKFRSEEHTSELQSIMRISYAVS